MHPLPLLLPIALLLIAGELRADDQALTVNGCRIEADSQCPNANLRGADLSNQDLRRMSLAGASATVDFNPVADRLRVIGSDGTSLRVNVDDGKVVKDGSLKYADGDANKGKAPKVMAGAYTNSVKGTKETTLLNIDTTTGALVKQAPPNDGILNTVGTLGPKVIG